MDLAGGKERTRGPARLVEAVVPLILPDARVGIDGADVWIRDSRDDPSRASSLSCRIFFPWAYRNQCRISQVERQLTHERAGPPYRWWQAEEADCAGETDSSTAILPHQTEELEALDHNKVDQISAAITKITTSILDVLKE